MSTDVLVVGGGPAGASTAFQLARLGVTVTLLDRARFPRAKPCAECLSPQASEILADMGVLEEVAARGMWLRGMLVRSPEGTVAHGDYVAHHGYRAFRDGGLSIRREILDATLLECARAAGVTVHEEHRLTDILRDDAGRVQGARVLTPSGSRDIQARFVVAADGLRSVLARRLRLARRTRWPDRISIVGHYQGVAGITAYGEMHVEHDGFVGIADVGDGVTTVAAVFPRGRARAMDGNPSAFLDDWLHSKSQLRARFAHARVCGVTSVTGPFASHARRAWYPGALLVGDAADFFDPFTGEGIYAALRGGQFAAAAAYEALVRPGSEAEALRGYEQRRRHAFRGKWLVERVIGGCVGSPSLVNRATRAMSARKELADVLVGVLGDFIPASEVLRLGYLARLFVFPLTS